LAAIFYPLYRGPPSRACLWENMPREFSFRKHLFPLHPPIGVLSFSSIFRGFFSPSQFGFMLLSVFEQDGLNSFFPYPFLSYCVISSFFMGSLILPDLPSSSLPSVALLSTSLVPDSFARSRRHPPLFFYYSFPTKEIRCPFPFSTHRFDSCFVPSGYFHCNLLDIFSFFQPILLFFAAPPCLLFLLVRGLLCLSFVRNIFLASRPCFLTVVSVCQRLFPLPFGPYCLALAFLCSYSLRRFRGLLFFSRDTSVFGRFFVSE